MKTKIFLLTFLILSLIYFSGLKNNVFAGYVGGAHVSADNCPAGSTDGGTFGECCPNECHTAKEVRKCITLSGELFYWGDCVHYNQGGCPATNCTQPSQPTPVPDCPNRINQQLEPPCAEVRCDGTNFIIMEKWCDGKGYSYIKAGRNTGLPCANKEPNPGCNIPIPTVPFPDCATTCLPNNNVCGLKPAKWCDIDAKNVVRFKTRVKTLTETSCPGYTCTCFTESGAYKSVDECKSTNGLAVPTATPTISPARLTDAPITRTPTTKPTPTSQPGSRVCSIPQSKCGEDGIITCEESANGNQWSQPVPCFEGQFCMANSVPNAWCENTCPLSCIKLDYSGGGCNPSKPPNSCRIDENNNTVCYVYSTKIESKQCKERENCYCAEKKVYPPAQKGPTVTTRPSATLTQVKSPVSPITQPPAPPTSVPRGPSQPTPTTTTKPPGSPTKVPYGRSCLQHNECIDAGGNHGCSLIGEGKCFNDKCLEYFCDVEECSEQVVGTGYQWHFCATGHITTGSNLCCPSNKTDCQKYCEEKAKNPTPTPTLPQAITCSQACRNKGYQDGGECNENPIYECIGNTCYSSEDIPEGGCGTICRCYVAKEINTFPSEEECQTASKYKCVFPPTPTVSSSCGNLKLDFEETCDWSYSGKAEGRPGWCSGHLWYKCKLDCSGYETEGVCGFCGSFQGACASTSTIDCSPGDQCGCLKDQICNDVCECASSSPTTPSSDSLPTSRNLSPGPNQGVFSGQLTGSIISNGTITLTSLSGKKYKTKTDANGNYALIVNLNEPYEVTISAPGYKDLTFNWTPTSSDKNYFANIKMEKMASSAQGNFEIKEVNRAILINAGWNLLTLPLAPAEKITAKNFLEQINSNAGEAYALSKWEDSRWETYSLNITSNDFTLEPGKAYFIQADKDSVWQPTGQDFTQPLSLNLKPGWNAIGLPKTTCQAGANCDASEVLTKTEGQIFSRFDFGLWDSLAKEKNEVYGNNFNLENFRGYFLKVAEEITFSP